MCRLVHAQKLVQAEGGGLIIASSKGTYVWEACAGPLAGAGDAFNGAQPWALK